MITFAELLEQHLAQIFRSGAWFARGSHAINGDGDAASLFVISEGGLHAGQLRVWWNAPRKFFQKRPPEKAAVDVIVENAGGVDNVGELGGAFLRLGHFRLQFFPFNLDPAQFGFDLERLIRVPSVIEKEERPATGEHKHSDLERVALPLPLLGNFLVQEIEVKCHCCSSGFQVFESCSARDVE